MQDKVRLDKDYLEKECFDTLLLGSLSDGELVEYCQQEFALHLDKEMIMLHGRDVCVGALTPYEKRVWHRNRELAKSELCRRYTPLIHKYANISHTLTMREDVEAHLWMVLLEAIQEYDTSGGIPFAGFVKSRIKFGHWNYYKKLKRNWEHEASLLTSYHKESEDDESIDDFPSDEDVADEVVSRIVEDEQLNRCMEALANMNNKERRIICDLYGKGKTMADMAREEGCSRQNIKYYHDKAMGMLRQIVERDR